MKEKMRNFEEIICVILLLAMVILITLQIVSRYFFSAAIGWTEELVRFLMIWLVFFGVSAGVKRQSFIKVEIFVSKLSEPVKKLCSYISYALCIAILLILIYQGTLMTIKMGTTPAVTMPITWHYVYSAVPIGSLFILFRLIQSKTV